MEAGNRCFDQNVPEEINRKISDHISDINLTYTEHSRRYLLSEGFRKDHVFVTGSPLFEVLHKNKVNIENSNVLEKLKLEKGKYFVVSAHREENIELGDNFLKLSEALNAANKFGLDPQVVNKVFNASTGRNNTTENKVENFMLNDAFNSGFSLALMSKDVQIALSFIEGMNCYANLAKQCVITASEANEKLGKGADHTAMYDYVRSQAR
jgi:UDP-N-acetylglucosamine 2-epimerase